MLDLGQRGMAPKDVAYGPNEPVLSPTQTLRVLSRPLIDRPHCAGAQSRTMRLPTRALVFAAVLLTACGAPLPSPTTTGTLVTAIAATPDSQPSSPTPTLTVAPTPTPLPTPSYVPPPPADSLHVDGLAVVAVERLRQVVDPENPTAHPRQNRALYVLVDGDAVQLTDGPRTIDGRDFWQVFDPDQPGVIDLWSGTGQPLGWVPAQLDGAATLTPFQPDCPTTLPTTAAELQRIQQLSELTGFACFGSREIVLTGQVRCYDGHGDGVLGAPFFDGRRACELDGVHINGQPIFDLLPASGPPREIVGTYEVRGQFDHPDSRRCTWIPFGTAPGPSGVPDPGAVASCRQLFVVTAVEEL